MRQSVRALGWTVTLSILLLSVFLATALYSVAQTALMERGIGLGEPQIRVLNYAVRYSLPLTVNNTGSYDLTAVRLTTALISHDGGVLATNTTPLDVVERGTCETAVHHLSIRLEDLFANRTYLMVNDTHFHMDASIGFRCAHALGFQITVTNTTMPWGAPFHALTLTSVSHPIYNGSHLVLDVAIGFENHFFTDVTGTLRVTAYNRGGAYIGSGEACLYAPVGSGPTDPVHAVITVDNPSNFTGEGYLEASLAAAFLEHPLALGRVDYD
jgi:hypothetical protein